MSFEDIYELRDALGDKVCIMGHHYQGEEVVEHCDITGDSLELARKVAGIDAPHVILCGVYFMAESAALLARPGQQIHIPDARANCVMSQMTPAPLLEKVLTRVHAAAAAEGRKVIPLAYVNTSVAVKSVVGRFGGAVCTSANAKVMLKWALEEAGDDGHVFFLPDKNLAQNTAVQLGLTKDDWHVLNVQGGGGFVDMHAVRHARMLLWPGCCAIHAKFSVEQIAAMREQYEGCQVVVHPECNHAVVGAADGSGSTTYLIEAVKNAPKGSTVIVGTEGNLVERLREDYAKHCQVVPLRSVYCSDMAKITDEKLFDTLLAIHEGRAEVVTVPEEQKAPAKASLDRMLEACAKAGI